MIFISLENDFCLFNLSNLRKEIIMNVASVSGIPTVASSSLTKDESVDQDYAALIAQFYPAEPYKTPDEKSASDTELQKFKNDLITKGSAQFLKDLNEEKINALVEEYRQKLLKEKEQNPDQPMDINQMVNDFRKQLLKEMMEAQKADQESKPKQNTALMSKDILEKIKAVQNEGKTSGLAELGFLEQILSSSNANLPEAMGSNTQKQKLFGA